MSILKKTPIKKTSIKTAANAKPKVEVKPIEKKVATPAKKPIEKKVEDKPKVLSLSDIDIRTIKANKD